MATWIRTKAYTEDGVQLWRTASVDEEKEAASIGIPVHYLDDILPSEKTKANVPIRSKS